MRKNEDEVLSRVRRIETRVTQLLIAQGIDTEKQRPVFVKQPGEHATVVIPSPHMDIVRALM